MRHQRETAVIWMIDENNWSLYVNINERLKVPIQIKL